MKTDPSRLAVLVHEVRSPVAALGAIAETFAQETEPAVLRVTSRASLSPRVARSTGSSRTGYPTPCPRIE